jgi:hypothetical protein
MAQKVLNEEQMREYVEREVRNALVNENMDEGQILDFIAGKLFGNAGNPTGFLGKLIKDHMNFPDVMNLIIGIFGVTPIIKWLCSTFGIDVNGPLANILITALGSFGTVAVGDAIQARRAAPTNGLGGNTSFGGGAGFSGGGFGGGSR